MPVSAGHADENLPVSIGTPLAGLSIAVVDSQLRTVAVGEAGELCLIGPTLAHGYLARDAVTALRFIRLPDFPQACAYRTGDRVQLGTDGLLRYLGRFDDEFKLSGYRIDPAEVESTLLGYPGIREVAVVGQRLPDGGKRLAAFLVAVKMPQLAVLRHWLTERLPAPAVPAAFSADCPLAAQCQWQDPSGCLAQSSGRRTVVWRATGNTIGIGGDGRMARSTGGIGADAGQ